MIKRYEANSLEEACSLASEELKCNIEELDYDIVQYPTKGFLGLFAKKAIIVVAIEEKKDFEYKEKESTKEEKNISDSNKVQEKDNNLELKNDKLLDDSEVLNSFYKDKTQKDELQQYESIDAIALETEIKRLFKHSCFNLDTIEVDIDNNTAYVFIDGDDAALLIGKEGYRYNALSYLLFNWINSKYGLYLKLEIAQFLASQQDMIIHQLKPVIEHINKEGWGRTRELNGILVQIALEYLRDTFPNKYVAIKRTKSGERYIIINEFNKR